MMIAGVDIPKRLRGYNARVRKPISSILGSAVMQWSANLYTSYPESEQAITNAITAPADGALQSAYNGTLGLNSTPASDDPVFVPGAPFKKFTSDGTQFMTVGANTAFTQAMLKTDAATAFWCVWCGKLGTPSGTTNLNGTTNASTVPGWRFDITTTPLLRFIRADGTTNSNTNLMSLTGLLGIPILIVFTYDNATQAYKVAVNSRTFTTGTAATITSTASNTGKYSFGKANNGSLIVPAGSELNDTVLGNSGLTDADLIKIVNYYNKLHRYRYA